ncbi:acetyl-CoA synthetase-like protein [Bimuria novae-zelandiae CBS 107.79]|uniref:Acetyl-CoA synthetase-like protein n=1 Tax=Bimuria novae-zelandiae CBS 107.79 TaxID=1447943 RepID=A0A6A5UYC8_9PLEO|nr:acetyl-CoA synthetase-like protein [Bimuria novae-zelandiae CBS 107.79]
MASGTAAPRRINNDPKRGTVFVTAIEEKVQWRPNETYMRYPAPNWEVNGYRTLTWGQYGNSINKVAHWLDEKLGKMTENEPVAYLGPNDLRYAVLWPAVVKTGRKLLLPDGRNTDEGLNALLEATKCSIWISAEDDAKGQPAALPSSMKQIALPSVEWCLDAAEHKHYPYEKTWDEAKWDEVLIIHSSGTTGMPKPIYHTNGLHTCHREHELSKIHWPRGTMYDAWIGKSVLSSCPPQWLGGMHHYVDLPVYNDNVCIVPPADCTLFTPEVFKKLIQFNIVDGIVCPPHTIVQLYAEPETRQMLKELQYIVYLGAALDQKVGDDLIEHTKVVSLIGSTETGKQVDLMPLNKKLWHTHDYVPENGSEMVRIEGTGPATDGSEDLHELVLHRPADGEANLWQPAFWNPQFRHLAKVETKELYAPIRDLDGRTRWILSARKDDLTKLEWLAKFHAKDIENVIKQHPGVSSVFVGGEGRPSPYVIVEPKSRDMDGEEADALLDEVYQSLSKGDDSHVEIRIPKETIFITKPGKPLKRSFKQTMMRKEIEMDYSAEIEAAYAQLAKVEV